MDQKAESSAAVSCRYQLALAKRFHLKKTLRHRKEVHCSDRLFHSSCARKQRGGECEGLSSGKSIDWKGVKAVSEARRDSHFPCSICRQSFGTRAQVLLSCSHVFHQMCLASFERFLVGKAQAKCPLCRTSNYKKTDYSEGKTAYLVRCATLIQSLFRMVRARKTYEQVQLEYYTRGLGEPNTRRKFLLQKLASASTQLEQRVRSHADHVNSLLAKADENLQLSKSVFRSAFEAGYAETGSNIAEKALREAEIDWPQVKKGVLGRGNLCCCICMEDVDVTGLPFDDCWETVQDTSLLPCSHLFHTACINSLEAYLEETKKLVCPLCRSPYDGLKQDLRGINASYSAIASKQLSK